MRTVTILILALTASSVMSNCVGPNAFSALLTGATAYTPTLLTTEITAAATAGTAATAAGAKCGYTATTTLICTTAEAKLIADIQSYITAQKTAMQTASGVRDQYIIEKRGDVIDVLSSLRRLNELADSNNDVTIPSTYLVFASAFIGYADEIASNFTSIVENFDDYQEARATCMDSLLQTQAAILCNVMVDDTITGITQTVNSEAVALSDTFLATLNTACFNYITYSVRQSSIILTAAYSKGIAKLVSGIEALANGDATTAATDLSSAFTTFGTVTFSSTASQVPAQTPSASGSACTSTSCAAWLEDLYSSTGVLDQTAAVRGGEAVSAFTWTSRVLSEGNERRLAATGFGPTLSSFSFTTGFEKNPANVDNTENANSALRNGIVAVAIAALALVF